MRIEDFEKAIDAKHLGLIIDEIKLAKGQVRVCYGHVGSTLIMWDEQGLAYSVEYCAEDGEDIDNDTHDKVSDSVYNRDDSFDLKLCPLHDAKQLSNIKK